MMPRKLIILLFLGLVLRLVLSVQIYSGDVNNHTAWGKDSIAFGFAGIYEREFFHRYGVLTPTYPPIPIFLFAAFYWLYQSVYQVAWNLNLSVPLFPSNLIFFLEDQDTLPAFLKIPAIMADMGIAVLVYLFAKKLVLVKANLAGYVGASLVLFNPAFFYNSSYWGQIESVPLFFVLLSFYILFFSRGHVLSAAIFALALLTKQTSIVFLPLFGLLAYKKLAPQKLAQAVLTIFAVFWLFFLPFFKSGNLVTFPFATYWDKIQTGSGSDLVTDHAFNFWTLVIGNQKISDSTSFILGIPFNMWGYGLFGFLALPTLFVLLKRPSNDSALFGAALLAMSAFLFLTRMHERYLEQALPFLLILGLRQRLILYIVGVLSVFHFANLYHNWWAPRIPTLVGILSQSYSPFLLAIVAIVSFFVLYIQYLKKFRNA